jgi:hypothetical protein
MQTHRRTLRSTLKLALCSLAFLGILPQLQAGDPTGTWVWSTPGRDGGEPRKSTLVLKAEAEKLTGKLIMPGRQGGEPREIAIKDGKIKGDEIAFAITVEFGGNERTMKYTAKLADDTLKGKIESPGRDGETRTREWEAKREKK